MKKILFGLILLVSLQGWSQVDTLREENMRKIGDILFQNLNNNIYGPNLLNRSFSSSEITLQQVKGNYNQIHSVIEFFELYQDLAYSYIDSTYLMNNEQLANHLDDIFSINELTPVNDELITPFGFLLHTVKYIDSAKINESNFQVNDFHVNVITDESQLYSTRLLKSAAVIEIYPESGYNWAKLKYTPSLVSVSPDITNLNLRINTGKEYVDFNENNPLIDFERTSDSLIGKLAFSYNIGGRNYFDTIKFYVTTIGEKDGFDANNTKSTNSWDYDRPFSRPYGVSYRYAVKTGCGNEEGKIRRPFIIVAPYRPTIQPFSLMKYYNQFNFKAVISSLADMGYDVIMIKQMPGNVSLEDAGKTLADFIDFINEKKEEDYPNESWENSIIGYSMGGQIARYALKLKEKEHMEEGADHHHSRLFIPFDSPNLGANIPMFTQLVYKDLKSTNFYAQLAYNSLTDEASRDMSSDHVVGSNFVDVPNSNVSKIYPAPTSERVNFVSSVMDDFNHQFTPLNDLRKSYPTFTRNVAVSTGRNDQNYTTEFSLDPGMLLFSQDALVLELGGLLCKNRKVYASKYAAEAPVFKNKVVLLSLFLIPIITRDRDYRTVYAYEWDMAQGGYKDEFYDKFPTGSLPILRLNANGWGQKHYSGHMNFLPTVSALGINPTIWANNNLFYNLKDQGLMYNQFNYDPIDDKSDLYGYPHLAHSTNHFTITPFEAIYCDPQTYEHIKMQASIDDNAGLSDVYLVHMRNFILDEVEADVVALQNKVIGKNHVQNTPGYKYKAWYKAYNRIDIGEMVSPKTNPGEYIIEATGDITVHAGQTISIKPGFHAQNGSDFHAYIDYECSRPRGEKSATSNTENSTDVVENNTSTQTRKTENRITTLDNKPKIYPNPNAGSFVVEIPDDQLGGNYSITDINGKILEQGIYTDAMKKSFTMPKGFYYFHWHFNGVINVQKIVVL